METTLLMKYIVTHAKFETIHELIGIIKAAGRILVEAQPKGNEIALEIVTISDTAYRAYGRQYSTADITPYS